MAYKSGFVAVVGRPNVGKSTLLNRLLGEKILIVSDKPQTTRNKIRCIYSEEGLQVIFLDTPGIHRPLHLLGDNLVQSALSSFYEVDQIWMLVEPDLEIGKGDRYIIDHFPKERGQVILVINKVDISPDVNREQIATNYLRLYPFNRVFFISALTGEGSEELMQYLRSHLPEGPMYYPEDMIVDQPERFIVAEIVREKILHLTREEIPHSCAVLVEEMKESDELVRINATIYVERESQKGMIIGKQGSMLKEIGTLARIDIEALLGNRVHLELWVKVRKDWRNKSEDLKHMGYRHEK
ncbi:MAG: GTPase Era [bacterium]|nr:GTPase Era [bacterium]